MTTPPTRHVNGSWLYGVPGTEVGPVSEYGVVAVSEAAILAGSFEVVSAATRRAKWPQVGPLCRFPARSSRRTLVIGETDLLARDDQGSSPSG